MEMDTKEYDGLVQLIKANHDENLRSFASLEERFSVKVTELDLTVKSHDRSIVKIKTIGTVVGSILSAIVLFFGVIFK